MERIVVGNWICSMRSDLEKKKQIGHHARPRRASSTAPLQWGGIFMKARRYDSYTEKATKAWHRQERPTNGTVTCTYVNPACVCMYVCMYDYIAVSTRTLTPPCDCSANGTAPILPRRACLRLVLLCTCPPLCAGVLWPMPAWVWRDVRSGFFFFFFLLTARPHIQLTWSSQHKRRAGLGIMVWPPWWKRIP